MEELHTTRDMEAGQPFHHSMYLRNNFRTHYLLADQLSIEITSIMALSFTYWACIRHFRYLQ